MEFEYPIVTTKHLLIKEHKKLLETNKDILVFDLGHDVQIFEPYIPNKIIKADSVLSFTEGVLLSMSNAYKWINEELLREMLFDYSNRLREISLGGVITNEGYDELIEKAIDLKDSFEVYLKEYPCLNEAFLQVNNLSGTSAQELTRYYNRKKISKVANCTY